MIPDRARPAAGLASRALAFRHGAPAAWRAPAVVDASLSALLAPTRGDAELERMAAWA